MCNKSSEAFFKSNNFEHHSQLIPAKLLKALDDRKLQPKDAFRKHPIAMILGGSVESRFDFMRRDSIGMTTMPAIMANISGTRALPNTGAKTGIVSIGTDDFVNCAECEGTILMTAAWTVTVVKTTMCTKFASFGKL